MSFHVLKNFNLRNKISLSVTGFILSMILIVYYLIIPTINDIKKMGMEIEKQKIDLEEKYQKGQSIKKLAEDLKKIEPLVSQLDNIYIDKANSLGLITDLEKIATENGVEQKINLVQTENNNNQYFQKIPIQLFVSGNFINQINYLEKIELLKYYINIQSLEISTAPQGSGNGGSLNTLIFADTYWH